MRSESPLLTAALAAALTLLLAACTPAWKDPLPVEQSSFLDRVASRSAGGLTVRTGVPNRQETEELFGTSLYADRIQPVWVEVQNHGDASWVLLLAGLDPEFFSPLEAAYQRHSGDAATRRRMDRFFYDQAFRSPIEPGDTVSGFVFTNVNLGAKALQLDFLSNERVLSFTFVVPVPGLYTDVSRVDFEQIYEEVEVLDSEEVLRERLAALPCCTTSKDGTRNGDPMNIVLVGDRQDIFAALVRREWHQTEVTYAKSALKTVRSFLFGSRYRYSPISALYVFDRPQDIGLQKARHSITLRNHMRLWRAPFDYRDKQVYVGQISRDIGVRFSRRTVTTHKIDPNIDATRDDLAGDLIYSQALHRVGWVEGSQASTFDTPAYNLSPDPYYSDGLRVVLFFGPRPVALEEIEFLDWARHQRFDVLR